MKYRQKGPQDVNCKRCWTPNSDDSLHMYTKNGKNKPIVSDVYILTIIMDKNGKSGNMYT